MTAAGKGGRKTTAQRSGLSLSQQTHQEILDYLKVASENSDHPEIRDAAIDLAKEKSKYQQKQTARLSPTLTMLIAVAILIMAGVASWHFFVSYTEYVASILTVVFVGLALVGTCLVAMFSGHLSQAHFVSVLRIVWSRVCGIFPRSGRNAVPDQGSEQSSALSNSDEA